MYYESVLIFKENVIKIESLSIFFKVVNVNMWLQIYFISVFYV